MYRNNCVMFVQFSDSPGGCYWSILEVSTEYVNVDLIVWPGIRFLIITTVLKTALTRTESH